MADFNYKQRKQTKEYEKGWVKVFGKKENSPKRESDRRNKK